MKTVGQLNITDNKKLILSIGEFKGDERIDLRQYILVNNSYVPTKRGINFNSEWLPDFVKMINKLNEK